MADDVIGVLVRISVLPEKIDEFVSTVQRTMIEPTQSVPGCIRYELWQDLDEPATFTIEEEWESAIRDAAPAACLNAPRRRPRLRADEAASRTYDRCRTTSRSSTRSLTDKVAVVTGGSSGIGMAMASAFVRDGARLVIFGRNHDALETARRQLGRHRRRWGRHRHR